MPIQLCAQLPQAAGTVSPIWMEQKMLKQKLWLWAATWHAYCGWILNSSLLIFNETPSRCYYYYCFLYEFFLLYLARQAVSQDAFINSLDVTIFTLIYKRCAVDGGLHDFTVVVTWLFVFWFFFLLPILLAKTRHFPSVVPRKILFLFSDFPTSLVLLTVNISTFVGVRALLWAYKKYFLVTPSLLCAKLFNDSQVIIVSCKQTNSLFIYILRRVWGCADFEARSL